MAANRLDPSKPAGENGKDPASAPPAADAPKPAAGGFKAWLPLLLNVLLMPVVAYAVTTFVLLPKMKAGSAAPDAAPADHAGESKAKKSDGAHGKDGGKGSATGGNTVALPGKVLVNVAGTMGTRYLLANMTLVGKSAGLKEAVEKNEARLRDAAASALASKTITDLEKPGARNLIRSELISVFNSVLGADSVSELYLTDFAIQ